jgi:tRNA(Ile)-lysidine synthase
MVPMNTLLLLHRELLRSGRNLLAFSHGLDSTALFYLLEEERVDFDLALVNYGLRPEADEEEAAARLLAERHGKRIFTVRAPRWKSGFEAQARKFRYDFFERVMAEEGYDQLLTAHQLNDRLEWMLMRLRRGAGTVELAGMRSLERRESRYGNTYRLIRPLLEIPRRELEHYLRTRGHTWHRDPGNEDGSNERSGVRPLAEALLAGEEAGVVRTFRYLEADRTLIGSGWRVLAEREALRVLELSSSVYASRAADAVLKELGYLLSAEERERIDRGESLVAGRRWAVELRGNRLYIAPYLPGLTVPKRFREACRRLGIPPKIRPYCFDAGIEPGKLASA